MILHLIGSINKHRLVELAQFLEESSNAVIIRITSDGGDPDVALAMAGLLKSWPGHVTTEIYGQCWSAATLVFAAGRVRRMQKYSWQMLHEGSESVEGTASAVKACAKQMERNELHWNGIMQELTGTDVKIWEKLNERDTYLNADECLRLNLATEILMKLEQTTDLSPNEQLEVTAALQTMLTEVKRKLKPCSKNELIRTICALLVDNYALKQQLTPAKAEDTPI